MCIRDSIKDYGPGIYLAPPSAFGWVVPYVAIGLGFVLLYRAQQPKELNERRRG